MRYRVMNENNPNFREVGGALPKVKKWKDPDPMHKTRQDNKQMVGPSVLMAIFGYCLQIGKEKGYIDDSWHSYLHPDQKDGILRSLKRHLIGVESGILEYDEINPKTEKPCKTKGNHAYALFWNAAVYAMIIWLKK
jgi:hypothetical protein